MINSRRLRRRAPPVLLIVQHERVEEVVYEDPLFFRADELIERALEATQQSIKRAPASNVANLSGARAKKKA